MEGFVIREAGISDRAEIAEMRVLLQEHLEASNPRIWRLTELGKQQIGLKVDEMLADKDGLVLVGEEMGGLVGVAWGHVSERKDYNPQRVASINLLFVRKAFRRRGIGSLLVRKLCVFFEAKGVENVSLNYILGSIESECFWSRLGFVPLRVTANTELGALKENLRALLE